MPTDPIKAIADARAALLSAEEALSNATAVGGDLGVQRKAVDTARRALRDAKVQVFATDPGLGLLDPTYPLLLLPVRLETRYVDNHSRLLVRIYPDDIHADSHDPSLSLEEISLQQKFFKTLASEPDEVEWPKHWRALAHAVGPLRALWLATGRSSVNRPAGWTRGAIARLLPDRFVAFAWTDPATDPLVVHAPHPVQEPLALGADPMRDDADATRPLGADARWLHDFSSALAAGMALEVSVNPAERIQRLVVIGVRASSDPAAQAIELARLLDAHRCTSGLSLLAPGEPTNALGETRTAYRVQPDVDQIYRDELAYWGNGPRRRPASWEQIGAPGQRFEGKESAGFRLDRAFGLVPGTLGRLAGSDDEWAAQERVLRNLLANVVTSGIEYMLAPSVSSEAVGSALKHFRKNVSAGGPFATIRIGPQPYGVLPVRLQGRNGLPGTGLFDLMGRLRSLAFEPAVDEVLRVSKRGTGVMVDPGRRMLEILRLNPVAGEVGVRSLLDPRLLSAVLPGVDFTDRTTIEAARQSVRLLLATLGDKSPGSTAIASAGLFDQVAPVTLAMVGDAAAVQQLRALRRPEPTKPNSEQPAWLWTTELLDGTGGPQRPYTLLYELARLAVIHAADHAAQEWLKQHAQDSGLPAPDFGSSSAAYGSIESRLRAPAPDKNVMIATVLDYGPDYVETGQPKSAVWSIRAALDYWDLRGDLGILARVSPDRLKLALGGVLGLLSYRLDAWYTGFATSRLHEMRVGPSVGGAPDVRQGIAVGAFGWLDAFPTGGQSRVAGYVHAPSAQHGATAAVLLSAHKAHLQQGHGSAFAIDLSSARVREALKLLEGLRSGQPLGALLGYRIERLLSVAAPAQIALLRNAAPLVANKRDLSGLPAENVAADNVVDGLALLRRAGFDGTNQPDWKVLNVAGLTADVQPCLVDAVDRLDALADVLLAEAVHHTVAGTPMSAGAAGDLLSGGPVGVPVDVEVARIGQRGTATTHKVMALFEAEAHARTVWTPTPRAIAEPALERWLASQLPDPTAIHVEAEYPLEKGGTAPVAVTLAKLLVGVKASRGLGAIDVVLLKPHVIERRLRALLETLRPEGSTGQATIVAQSKRMGRGDIWSLAEVAEMAGTLRGLLGGARGLSAADFDAMGRAATVVEDSGDLESRLSRLRDTLVSIRDALKTAADDKSRLSQLEQAELLGLETVPDSGTLDAAAASVVRTLDRRIADGDDASRPLVERFRSLGGPEVVAIPQLSFDGLTLAGAFAAGLGATTREIRTFLARYSNVRDSLARLNAALAHSEALAGGGALSFELAIAQHPHATGERWTALPGPLAAGRTSYVAVRAASLDLGSSRKFAGLFIDAWTEVVPRTEADTALVFDAHASNQTAPNAMLLLVPEAGRGPWTESDVLAYVLEALSLSKLRAIDPDQLTGLGQLLPGLVLHDGDAGGSLADLWTSPVQT